MNWHCGVCMPRCTQKNLCECPVMTLTNRAMVEESAWDWTCLKIWSCVNCFAWNFGFDFMCIVLFKFFWMWMFWRCGVCIPRCMQKNCVSVQSWHWQTVCQKFWLHLTCKFTETPLFCCPHFAKLFRSVKGQKNSPVANSHADFCRRGNKTWTKTLSRFWKMPKCGTCSDGKYTGF